jgi:hypothetical protein
VYVMYGTARTGDLAGIERFEETMMPYGPGRIAALAIARWRRKDGSSLDAIFSTRYEFGEEFGLEHPQFRRLEAKPVFEDGTFRCSYTGVIRPLTEGVDLSDG